MTDSLSLGPLFLRWSRLLALDDEDRAALLALPWQRRRLQRDAYLVREGEPARTCSLLIEGLAFRQKILGDGSRQIISFHIPGEFLDLQNCLLDVADHNVQTLTKATVLTLPKEAFLALMEERPAVRQAIWMDSLLDASVFREWVVNVGRRRARQRIAHLFCELSLRMKAARLAEGPVFDFPVTQEHIADATGLTVVHTNRTLQALRRAGLISLQASKLTILHWDALADVGDFNERYLHHSA